MSERRAYLTLERRGHPPLTLFGVTDTGAALEAGAFICPGAVRAGTQFKHQKRRYALRAAILPQEHQLHIGLIVLEVVRGR